MEKMKKLYFDGELSLSCGGAAYIKGAEVFVPEEATMNQIVTAIRGRWLYIVYAPHYAEACQNLTHLMMADWLPAETPSGVVGSP